MYVHKRARERQREQQRKQPAVSQDAKGSQGGRDMRLSSEHQEEDT